MNHTEGITELSCDTCEHNRTAPAGAGTPNRSLTARPQLTASGGATALKIIPQDLAAQLVPRILEQIVERQGCWIYVTSGGKTDRYNNIRVVVDGRARYYMCHRVSYTHFKGPIPGGLTIDHLCKQPACVNPAHMEAVTQGENVRRSNNMAALNSRKTVCKRGHEFRQKADGKRFCPTCANANAHLRRLKRKAVTA